MTRQALRVLGVNGSLHEKGGTITLLRHVLQMVEKHGGETRMLDLREVPLPLYRPDHPGHAAAQERVATDMNWAQAVILASPDYHGSMSGAMKNFLDYVWAECAEKVFAYLCASHEKGLTVMDHMRVVVCQCYGWSMPYGASYNPKTDLDATGGFINAKFEDRLKMMARDLVVYGALVHEQFTKDLAGKEDETFAAVYRQLNAK